LEQGFVSYVADNQEACEKIYLFTNLIPAVRFKEGFGDCEHYSK